MKFGKLAKIFVFSSVFLSTDLLQANDYVTAAACQENYSQPYQLIKCLQNGANEILNARDDIMRLRSVAERIRGKSDKNPQQKTCGRTRITTVNYDIPATVRGGKCSGYWNNMVKNRSEYVRLICLNWYEGEENVDRAKALAKSFEKKFNTCFDQSIPESIKQDFPVNNQKELILEAKRLAKEYAENGLGREYKRLHAACVKNLMSLEKKDPDMVRNYRLSCERTGADPAPDVIPPD